MLRDRWIFSYFFCYLCHLRYGIFIRIGMKKRFLFSIYNTVIIAFAHLIFTRNNPKKIKLPVIIEDKYELDASGKSEKLKILVLLLKNRALWIYSSCYMILKMMRYAFLFWLPIYLEKSLRYDVNEAGYIYSRLWVIGIFRRDTSWLCLG